MLISLGNRVRLTAPLACRLERITGVRPTGVRSTESLVAYFTQQLERFGDGTERHEAIRAVLLEEAKRLLSALPVVCDGSWARRAG